MPSVLFLDFRGPVNLLIEEIGVEDVIERGEFPFLVLQIGEEGALSGPSVLWLRLAFLHFVMQLGLGGRAAGLFGGRLVEGGVGPGITALIGSGSGLEVCESDVV